MTQGRRAKGKAPVYGAQHKRWADILPDPTGKPCPYCGHAMDRGQRLDLDHVVPVALGGADGPRRWAHARCNRMAGSRLGHQRKAARRRQRQGNDQPEVSDRSGQRYTPGYTGRYRQGYPPGCTDAMASDSYSEMW